MQLFRGNAQEATSSLIAAIYDAALDPAKWQNFVDAVTRELGGVEPVLYLADTKTAIMETLLVSENWGTEFLAEYMAHYNVLNPWTPHLTTSPALWQPVVGDEVMTDGEFKRTEFYNDFFREYLDSSGVVGVVNYRDRNAFSLLGLHTTRGLYEQHNAELRHLISQLSPHITRAFEISRELQHGAARKASLELMLDGLVGCALIIGADLRVRYANRAAEALFHSGVLRLDGKGRIAAGAGADETGALRLALTAALSPGSGADARSAVKLSRCDDDGCAAMPLLGRIMPCAGGLDRPRDSSSPVPAVECEPEALLLITDSAAKLHIRQRRLKQLFDMTSAEARLAQALTQGMSLESYAAGSGIAVATARAQLKGVFAKTNTHRQAELVALLATLAQPFQLT